MFELIAPMNSSGIEDPSSEDATEAQKLSAGEQLQNILTKTLQHIATKQAAANRQPVRLPDSVDSVFSVQEVNGFGDGLSRMRHIGTGLGWFRNDQGSFTTSDVILMCFLKNHESELAQIKVAYSTKRLRKEIAKMYPEIVESVKKEMNH